MSDVKFIIFVVFFIAILGILAIGITTSNPQYNINPKIHVGFAVPLLGNFTLFDSQSTGNDYIQGGINPVVFALIFFPLALIIGYLVVKIIRGI